MIVRISLNLRLITSHASSDHVSTQVDTWNTLEIKQATFIVKSRKSVPCDISYAMSLIEELKDFNICCCQYLGMLWMFDRMILVVFYRTNSRCFILIFLLRQTNSLMTRMHDAAGKIERASSVNTINQLNPRVERNEGLGMRSRPRECGLTKAKKKNNFGVSVSEFADRANTMLCHRIKTACVAMGRNKTNYRVVMWGILKITRRVSCL